MGYQQASDLLERALFAFENGWHSLFLQSLKEGNARLDFSTPLNNWERIPWGLSSLSITSP